MPLSPEFLFLLKTTTTREELSALLGLDYKALISLTITSHPTSRYAQFDLKKKSGGVRKIKAPVKKLKQIQWKINPVLQGLYSPKPSVHGFVGGDKSILSNARVHLGKKHVLNIDLKDFFPSINFGRVRGVLMAKPYELNSELATIIAQICCHENELPQGAPTSPVISNMICSSLDTQLQRLAKKLHCTYSRYADDITFSCTTRNLPPGLAVLQDGGAVELGTEVKNIIETNGFQINYSKIRARSHKVRQEVTGLTVNKFPNVRRQYIRQIRAMLNAAEKYGLEAAGQHFVEKYDKKHRAPHKGVPQFSHVLNGKLAFLRKVKGINDPVYQALLNRYNVLLNKPVTVALSTRELIAAASWILECETTFRQGSAFYLNGVGFVTCAHVVGEATHAFNLSNPAIKYPINVIAKHDTVDLAIFTINAPAPQGLDANLSIISTEENITVVGFPNFNLGDSVTINKGSIISTRMRSGIRCLNTSARIVAGNSGGAALDDQNRVVGVAATGSDSPATADQADFHGIIPITALQHLGYLTAPAV